MEKCYYVSILLKMSKRTTNIIPNKSFKDNDRSFCDLNIVYFLSKPNFPQFAVSSKGTLKMHRWVSFFLMRNSLFFIFYNQKKRPSKIVTMFVFLITLITIILLCFLLIKRNVLFLAFLVLCLVFACFLHSLLRYLLINFINEKLLLKVN